MVNLIVKCVVFAFVSGLSQSFISSPLTQSRPTFVSTTYSTTTSTTTTSSSLSQSTSNYEYALLFDCDGVILETEELHRRAYNAAFTEFGLTIDGEPVIWSVEYYDMLQNTVGGGKPKMFYHFRNTAGKFPVSRDRPEPQSSDEEQALIDLIQDWKTDYYKKLLATESDTRPGVLELMDEALADPTIAVGVCSAATKAAAEKTLDITLGSERVQKLDVCILGDDVPEKKPNPLIYNVARERLGMTSEQCVVVEDSLIGLQAAKGANMKCIITYTSSTASQDFYSEGADAKVPDLASREVRLSSIFDPIRENGLEADILKGLKDPVEITA